MKKCAVLGNGPAGLMAAHAAMLKGYDVEIISASTQPSVISGAQYLDRPIAGISDQKPDGMVHFYKKGSVANYAAKIYGDPMAATSWTRYEDGEAYPMWDMTWAYKTLWSDLFGRMENFKVDANYMASLLDVDVSLIVSTIPLKAICFNPEQHTFKQQTVAIYEGLPALGEKRKWLKGRNNELANWIVYSGKKKDAWYRCSRINGIESTEYPYKDGDQRDPEVTIIHKPLSTDCNCWANVSNGQPMSRIILAGRYGAWDKNQLAGDAYTAVMDHHAV